MRESRRGQTSGVTVTIYRHADGSIAGFEAAGHAGFAPHGEDIVCAAVSVLAQATVLGLSERLGLAIEVEQRHGYLRCMLPTITGSAAEGADVLLDTMWIGLRAIQEQYPEHVSLREARADSAVAKRE